MSKKNDTTIPIGNNDAEKAGLRKLTNKEKSSMVQTIIQSTAPYWLNQMIAIIDIRLLDIDGAYQRDIHGKSLTKLIDEFDPRLMSPLNVSVRNNQFFTIDGRHRTTAAIVNGLTSLPCILQTGLTQAEEAAIFASQKKCIANLTALEQFKANVVAGDPIDTDIKMLCDKYGLTITNTQAKRPYVMSSVTGCREIVGKESRGVECLDWIFSTFKAAKWLSEINACTSNNITSMGYVWEDGIRENNLDIKTKRLIEVFTSAKPTVVHGYAVVKYDKSWRSGTVELLKDIANGIYTAADIEACHVKND